MSHLTGKCRYIFYFLWFFSGLTTHLFVDFGWRYFTVRCFWSTAVINYTASYDVIIDVLFTFV